MCVFCSRGGGGGGSIRPGRPTSGVRRTRGEHDDADFDTLPEELEQEFSFLYSRQVGEKIYAMSFDDGQIYAGKIIKRSLKYTGRKGARGSQSLMRNPPVPHYLAHYKGWSSRYEEWVQESQILTDEQVRKSGKVRIGPDRGDESTSSSDSQDTESGTRDRHRSAEKKRMRKLVEMGKGETSDDLGTEAGKVRGSEPNSMVDTEGRGQVDLNSAYGDANPEDTRRRSTQNEARSDHGEVSQLRASSDDEHENEASEVATGGSSGKEPLLQAKPKDATEGADAGISRVSDKTGEPAGDVAPSGASERGERSELKATEDSTARRRGDVVGLPARSGAEEIRRKRRKRLISSTSEDSSEAESRQPIADVEKESTSASVGKSEKRRRDNREKAAGHRRDSREKSVAHRESSQDARLASSESEARNHVKKSDGASEKKVKDKKSDRKHTSEPKGLDRGNSRDDMLLGADEKEKRGSTGRAKSRERERSRGRESSSGRGKESGKRVHREKTPKDLDPLIDMSSGVLSEASRDTDKERGPSRERDVEKQRQKARRRKEREKERARRNSGSKPDTGVLPNKSSTLIVRLTTPANDTGRVIGETPSGSGRVGEKVAAVAADAEDGKDTSAVNKNDIARPHKPRTVSSPKRKAEKAHEIACSEESNVEVGLDHASDDSLDLALENAHAAKSKSRPVDDSHVAGSKISNSKAIRAGSNGLETSTSSKKQQSKSKHKDVIGDHKSDKSRSGLTHSTSVESLERERSLATVTVSVSSDTKGEKRDRVKNSEKKVGRDYRKRDLSTERKDKKTNSDRESTSRHTSRPSSTTGIKREGKDRGDSEPRRGSSTGLDSSSGMQKGIADHSYQTSEKAKEAKHSKSSRPSSRLDRERKSPGVLTDQLCDSVAEGIDDTRLDVKQLMKRSSREKGRDKETERNSHHDKERGRRMDRDRSASRDKGSGNKVKEETGMSSKSGATVRSKEAEQYIERSQVEVSHSSASKTGDMKHRIDESPRKHKIPRDSEREKDGEGRTKTKNRDRAKHKSRERSKDRGKGSSESKRDHRAEEFETPTHNEDRGGSDTHARGRTKKHSGGEKSKRTRDKERDRSKEREREKEKTRLNNDKNTTMDTDSTGVQARSRSLSAHSGVGDGNGGGGAEKGLTNQTNAEEFLAGGSIADSADGVVKENTNTEDMDGRENVRRKRDKQRRSDKPVSEKAKVGRDKIGLPAAVDDTTTPDLKTPKSTEDVLTETSQKLLNYALSPIEDQTLPNEQENMGKNAKVNNVAKSISTTKSHTQQQAQVRADSKNDAQAREEAGATSKSHSELVPDERKHREATELLCNTKASDKINAGGGDQDNSELRSEGDRVATEPTSDFGRRTSIESRSSKSEGRESVHTLRSKGVDTRGRQSGESNTIPVAGKVTGRGGADGPPQVSVTVVLSSRVPSVEGVSGQTRPEQPSQERTKPTPEQSHSGCTTSLSQSISTDKSTAAQNGSQQQPRGDKPPGMVSTTQEQVLLSHQKAADEFSVKHILAQSARERSAKANLDRPHSLENTRANGLSYGDTHTAPAAPTPTQMYDAKEVKRSSSDGTAKDAEIATGVNANSGVVSSASISNSSLPTNEFSSARPRAPGSIGSECTTSTARVSEESKQSRERAIAPQSNIPAHMAALKKQAEADSAPHGTQATLKVSYSATSVARQQLQPIPRSFSPVPGGGLLPNILPPKKRMFYSSGDHTPDYNAPKIQRPASPKYATGASSAPNNLPANLLARNKSSFRKPAEAGKIAPVKAGVSSEGDSMESLPGRSATKLGSESVSEGFIAEDTATNSKRPMGSRLTMMLASSRSDKSPA